MDSHFSFFVLPDAAGTRHSTLQVDAAGNPARKRQPHHKSRSGCATCKRRKVKVRVFLCLHGIGASGWEALADIEISATKHHLLV
jgi:hypothetical protein